MQPKGIVDDYAVLADCNKNIDNDEFKLRLLEVIAELEDNDNYVHLSFPKSRLHKLKGVKQAVYRADIDKTSGWRLHVQYGDDHRLHLKDVLPPEMHDNAKKAIKAKKYRYD